MSVKIPVAKVYEYLDMMLRDKWGYIYGTAGTLWTQSKQNSTTNEMAQKYGSKWIGHMVTDCSGVMVYIWRQFGLKIPHGSSSMVRQGYIVDCGPDPHPGWAALVDKTPDTPDNSHIGIVGRDGVTVYEAKGTQSGFVTSKVTDSKWTKFGRFVDVDYTSSGADAPPSPEGKAEKEAGPMDGGKRVYYRARVTTNGGKLHVRVGPSTKEKIRFNLENGEIVDVMSEFPDIPPKGWAWIDDDGALGYASMEYLTQLPEETSPSADADTSPDRGGQGEAGTTLLRRADGITIELAGAWEVYKE